MKEAVKDMRRNREKSYQRMFIMQDANFLFLSHPHSLADHFSVLKFGFGLMVCDFCTLSFNL